MWEVSEVNNCLSHTPKAIKWKSYSIITRLNIFWRLLDIFNARRWLKTDFFNEPIEISCKICEDGSHLLDTTASVERKDADHCVILNQRRSFVIVARTVQICWSLFKWSNTTTFLHNLLILPSPAQSIKSLSKSVM